MSSAAAEVPRSSRNSVRDKRPAAQSHDVATDPPALQRGVSFGVLAMLPLFVAYEIAFRLGGSQAHNTAEFLLTLPLSLLGDYAGAARIVALGVCVALCVRRCFHSELGLVARVGRVVGEGFLAAIVIGPVLILLQRALSLPEPALAVPHHTVPPLASGLFHVSGAAFEEIVFRVGLQSAFFVLVLEVARFFTAHERGSRLFAEGAAVLLAALVFAAAHLAPVLSLFGAGGEPFDGGLFAWRFLAGVWLGVLFRARGPGVAAWAHAFFNLALYVGAGPDVFL